ncbi:MAG: hypothetical protein M1813_003620 [Trichoglossum hirsutum]|nr:MAG: hypothetical protein M1813_003620 [Trichoglossum hirsutum]
MGSSSYNGAGIAAKQGNASHKDVQPQLVASAPLDPVHSSKAAEEARPRPQRHPSTEPLPQTAASTPLRRSKRLQPPGPSIAKGATGATSTDSPKSIARPRPKRKTACNPISAVPAKPQGTPKRQRSSTVQDGGRREGDSS